MTIGAGYLEDALREFRRLKSLAERALAQTGDGDLFRALDAETNSIAVVMKHMAGNMRSRWTDFLTTDGEKPDRNRIPRGKSREFDMTKDGSQYLPGGKPASNDRREEDRR